MLLKLNIGSASFYSLLFLHSPFIFWLLLLPLKGRFLELGEIDLYAGVSSKLIFLGPLLFSGDSYFLKYQVYPGFAFLASGYAYTMPLEIYIKWFLSFLYYLITGHFIILDRDIDQILNSILSLSILALYLTLLYWRRQYRKTVAKAFFIFSIVVNMLVLFFISLTPMVYYTLIYLIYLALNAYRVKEIYK